ncbi:uncharacterized protein LOC142569089 isoform X3 [Dermacentor variabilis]
MWMWEALKSGNEDLWNEHAGQFVETERQAYSMVTTEEEEQKYTARIEDILGARLAAITGADIYNAYKEKTTTALFLDMLCKIPIAYCVKIIKINFDNDPDFYTDENFKPEPMSPEAVACYVGYQVRTTGDFAAQIKLNSKYLMGMEAPLSVRLAFCGCVPRGLSQDVNEKINEASTYNATLKSAQALHLIRTMDEFTAYTDSVRSFRLYTKNNRRTGRPYCLLLRSSSKFLLLIEQ